jgi:rubrerythrin
MTIYKKGTCSSTVKASKSAWVCNACGHTTMSKSEKCPKCDSDMTKVSSDDSENTCDNDQKTV